MAATRWSVTVLAPIICFTTLPALRRVCGLPSKRLQHRSSFLVEHDLFGKPASTPDQVRGRLFPDHALIGCGNSMEKCAGDAAAPAPRRLPGAALTIRNFCERFVRSG